jgi:addiction module HigA family antidote
MKKSSLKLKISAPSHPGEILLIEFLQPHKIPQRQFAAKLGWTPAKLNELVKGKRGITPASALDLSEALNTTAEFWLNMQMQFDLFIATSQRKKQA